MENGCLVNEGQYPSQSVRNDVTQPINTSLISDFRQQSSEFGEITEIPNYETLNTSAILHYCKKKILKPYLRLLGVLGLRPNEDSQYITLWCILGNLHTLQVIVLICIGYILQYMACYRRDRGFCGNEFSPKKDINDVGKQYSYNSCQGSAIFGFFVPNFLHLIAYLYTVYLFKIKEIEQLQNLMERAFLLSSYPGNQRCQKRIVKILWLFISFGIIWIIASLISVVVLSSKENIKFKWLEYSSEKVQLILKIFLVLCTSWHDLVQGMIVTSYCIQAQLLISHLHFLRVKILHHTVPGLEWMKQVEEFKKQLKYLNNDFSPAVCFYTVTNISWALSATVWLLYKDVYLKNEFKFINVVNAVLWMCISIAPFVQAARLTSSCSMIQNIGHEVRVRPYVYQATPEGLLDSLLIYCALLKMSAKLFAVPITGRYLCLLLTMSIVTMLTIGQTNIS